jgi:Ca2+-transporting ATPase
VLICVALFAAGVTRGEPILTMFLTALSLAVAAIPEALPAVVSVALALGARRMAQENALVRRLPAVETLGSVTYVCSDKTGTLTQNQMHVEQVVLAGTIRRVEDLCVADEQAAVLLRAMALNSDVQRGVDGRFRGDPTETALRAAAEAAGLDVDDLQQRYARVHELPFDSDRKMMTTFHRVDRAVVAYTKGAPEAVFAQCANTPAQSLSIVEWSQAAQALAGEGYRVLAFARRCWETLPPGIGSAQAETGLELVGLAALVDPPRAEAAAAVAACRKAGITPVMITGDHASTARTIAIRLGILDQGGRILTGEQLAAISAQDFAQVVDKVRVYARVTPQQKIDIVQALQARGEFVAMTGDGVNDAPALKRADIGVAMGERGTDVARESSQLVLLDDNFATIVAAVAEGRRIYDNVRKFIKYTMTSNSGEIWTIALAPLLGLPIPLLPIHILWINLVTDGLPGLALANEPPEKDLMARPPRLPAESVFAHGMWQHMLWVGLLMGGTSLAAQVFAMSVGWTNWQTIVFTVLTFSQLGHALAIRSDKQSLFSQGLFSNRALALSVGLIVLLQLATIYVTSLNAIFRTEALSLPQLLFCLAMSSVVFVAVELEKAWRRRGSMQR